MGKPFWDKPELLDALHEETSSPEASRLEAEVHPAFRPFLKVEESEYRQVVREILDDAPDEIWDIAHSTLKRAKKRRVIKRIGEASWMEILMRVGAVLATVEVENA